MDLFRPFGRLIGEYLIALAVLVAVDRVGLNYRQKQSGQRAEGRAKFGPTPNGLKKGW